MPLPSPIAWTPSRAVRILDQSRLPAEERYLELGTVDDVAEAIRSLRVRGAPLIGIAAAMGVVQAVRADSAGQGEGARDPLARVREACRTLGATRPTAVNLHWALARMERRAERALAEGEDLTAALVAEADAIWAEDRCMCERIGRLGAELLPDGATVLTHCNAGALATVGYGTALGVIRAAVEEGKKVHVYADETRPRLQGMKLTAWELAQDNIPVTVIADNMAASLMRQGKIDCVVVGADRIASNGDTANKIGTYGVAVLARHHNIPFYVAAPFSTIDMKLASGIQIPIEQRETVEMTHIEGIRVAPEDVPVLNPAFDITPGELVTAFITEQGVIEPPYETTLAQHARQAEREVVGAGR